MRFIDSPLAPTSNAWHQFYNNIGKYFPDFFLCKFVNSDLSYRDRCFFIAHIIINNLHLETFFYYLRIINVHFTPQRERHMYTVYNYLRNASLVIRRKYYAYSIYLERVVDLTLHTRRNLPPSRYRVPDVCQQFLYNGPSTSIYNDLTRDDQEEVARALDDWEANYA